MPTSEQILEGLTRIANDAFAVGILWHVAIALAILAVVLGWRPSRRVAGLLLSLPAASAGALAFVYGNPFNGAVLAALWVTLVAAALRLDGERVRVGPGWALAVGAALALFGAVYPHFLGSRPAIAYLYGAPTGLVPCPTLSLMIGLTLILGGLGSRLWSLPLAAAGVFYGTFGAARLGVTIDVVLLAGAVCLIALVRGRVNFARRVLHSNAQH